MHPQPYWIYRAFHSLLSVIESRNTVSIPTREILSNAPPLVGGLSSQATGNKNSEYPAYVFAYYVERPRIDS
jgi:hypothetical protein